MASILTKISGLDPDTRWDDLDSDTVLYIKGEIEKYNEKIYQKYSKAQIISKQAQLGQLLINGQINNPIVINFKNFIAAAFSVDQSKVPSLLADHPQLSQIMQKFFVLRLYSLRNILPNYHGIDNTDVDGISPLQDMPLPIDRLLKDHKEYALDLLNDLNAYSAATPTDPSLKNVLSNLERGIQQHADLSLIWNMGGNDLYTLSGLGSWVYDFAWAHGDPNAVDIYPDQEELVTAYASYLMSNFIQDSWQEVQESTVKGFSFYSQYMLSEAHHDSYIANSAVKIAMLLLGKWMVERLEAMPAASKACLVYTPQQANLKWKSFLRDANIETNLDINTFRDQNFPVFRALFENDFREMAVSAGETFLINQGASAAVQQGIEDVVRNTAKPGKVLEAMEEYLRGINPDYPTIFNAPFEQLSMVESETEAQQLWKKILAFLNTEYGVPFHLVDGELDIDLNSYSAYTIPSGEITFGLKGGRPMNQVISTMIHEAHHSIAAFTGVGFGSIVVTEGSAEIAAQAATLKAFNAIFPDYGQEKLIPYYVMNFFMVDSLPFIAKAHATYEHLTTQPCQQNSMLGYLHQNATNEFGLSEEFYKEITSRSVHGTSYLQYSIGKIYYQAYVEAMREAVGVNSLHAFQLQLCGVMNAGITPEKVQKLKTCLGL